MEGNKLLQSQVGQSPDYSDDYNVQFAEQVGIRLQQGIDGEVATGSDNLIAASATFLPEHVGTYIVSWDSGFPGNNVVAEILAVVGTTEVTLNGVTFITESGLTWAHHKNPSTGSDLAFIRTMLAKTRHPTRAWNDTSPRKGIYRALAFTAAETSLTLPNSLTYKIDDTDNGLYLEVYFNGVLWTPDDGASPVDYEEFSANQIKAHHDINIGDVLSFIVRGA